MKGREGWLTEEKLVLIHQVPNTEVQSTEDENGRLDNAVQHRYDEDENGLRVHDAVIDHRRCIQLGKV